MNTRAHEPTLRSKDLAPGELLGRYELLLPIAEGGMAVVWAARLKGSRGFSKTVAVKTMLAELSQEVRFEKMFLDEARIASRIKHPNVVEILDLGEQDEQLYIVMEWVDGEPLANLRRDAVKHGGMPLGVAVEIVRSTAAGLHAAHELTDEHTREPLGLVHRDISPQNILVTFDGVVKVVDFGVAKARGRSTEKTSAGHVKGKPPYMSPEQATGDEVDRSTDVFALGIILYQLVTGKHPFRGESDLVTLQNIVSDKPVVPPRAHNRECPKALEAVILGAIQRDPAQRFQSAREFEQALEAATADLPRTRQEDVAKFVQRMAGERGERRRQQLHEATLLAEERSVETRMPTPSGRTPPLFEVDPHGRTLQSRSAPKSDVTQLAEAVPRPRRRMLPWLVLSLFAVGALVAFAIALGGEGPATTRASVTDPAPPAVTGAAPPTPLVEAHTGAQVRSAAPPNVSPSPTLATAPTSPLSTGLAPALAAPEAPERSAPRRPALRAGTAPVASEQAPPAPGGSKESRPTGFRPPPVGDPGF